MARTILSLLILIAFVSPVIAGPWHGRHHHYAPIGGSVQVFGGAMNTTSAYYAPAASYFAPASALTTANTFAISPFAVPTVGIVPATLNSSFAVPSAPQSFHSQGVVLDRLLDVLIGRIIGGLTPQPPPTPGPTPPPPTDLDARVQRLERDVAALQQLVRGSGSPDGGDGGFEGDTIIDAPFAASGQSLQEKLEAATSPLQAYNETMLQADRAQLAESEAIKRAATYLARQAYSSLWQQTQIIDRRYEQVKRQRDECHILLEQAQTRLKSLEQ